MYALALLPAVASMPHDDEEEEGEDAEDDEEDDEDDMKWACDVTHMRFMKKAKKEHIALLCGDFGIPTSGNKRELSQNLAEQLHYETDDDDDDDDA